MELLPAFFQQPYAAALPNEWKLNVHETHRDQVLEMPPGAELLATSEQTPLEIWRLGKNVLAVQGMSKSDPELSFLTTNLERECP